MQFDNAFPILENFVHVLVQLLLSYYVIDSTKML